MGRNRKFTDNVIKITEISSGKIDYALDVNSAAHAINVKPVAIYQAFNRNQRRVKNFVLQLISLDEFIKKDA